MRYRRPVYAAIFDMDGLLIDSEPLWDQAEMEVLASLGVDVSRRAELPDTLGLRIDQTVRMWYEAQPWQDATQADVTARIIDRTLSLIEAQQPLLPGVDQALRLCQQQGLRIALASASPLAMLERVRGEPVFLIAAMTADKMLRLKPQNLVTGLPVRNLEVAS